MQRREAAVEATRHRLVEATVALHNEKGVLATTMQDIAARADVALGTAYRHFPTMGDAVFACGARLLEISPLPTAAVFDGATSPDERLWTLVGALYRYYDGAQHWLGSGYNERSGLPALDQAMSQIDAHIAALVDAALSPLPVDVRFARAVHGFSRFYAWKAFSLAGMSTEEAIELVAEILCDRAMPAEAESSRPKGREHT
jgi:AcrR family transcriptional regulator